MKPAKSKTSSQQKHISLLLLLLAALLTGTLASHAETPVQAWVHRYTHPLGGSDGASKVVTDTSGNIIVAGSSDNNVTGPDMVVIKYSGEGLALWTNRYNGPGNGNDLAAAATVDDSGNVYVTGYSYGISSGWDYVTIAYSGSGIALWTNRFNGPGNGNDEALAIAADNITNVYVTGRFTGNSGTGYGIATIAYSSAGVALWTNRYSGNALGSSDDLAKVVLVDKNNHIYVIGSSRGSGTYYDFVTLAYSGSGVALWTNRYNGPANSTDYANAATLDGGNNVCVAGMSHSGASYDLAVIAYSSEGLVLWTNVYDGPANDDDQANAITADENNLYVTGNSIGTNNNDEYVTIAYSSVGLPLWTNRYHGPDTGNNRANAIAVDSSNNVFVTGYDYATIAYSSTGIPLWTNLYNSIANALDIAVDNSGHIYVTGNAYGASSSDFVTVAYSSAGTALWTNHYDGPWFNSGLATAVAVGSNNNVYVTGYSIALASNDYATVAYSSAGVPLWTNSYGGNVIQGSRGDDRATDVAVDSGGRVLVTGFSSHSSGSYPYYDYATLAYSSAGIPLWTNRYDGPGFGDAKDQATALATDSTGRIFVTGYSVGVSGYSNYLTIAYSTSGAALWTNRYSVTANSPAWANAIALDANGNVFVTGSSYRSGSSDDFATIKYSPSGTALWTNRYDGPTSRLDVATDIALDSSGNVFVVGYSDRSNNTTSTNDYAIIMYSNAGLPLWTNRYNGPANGEDRASAVAVDRERNVFVAGYSTGISSGSDYATIKYSEVGVALWTNRYNGPANGSDRAAAIGVDLDGNVFVTGFSQSFSQGYNYDYATIKYSNAGIPLWTNRYNGPVNGDDQPQTKRCLAIGSDGAVYVTGASDGDYTSATKYNYATVKYISLPEIASPPTDRTNNVSTTAAFTVSATGSAPLRYQWQRSETNLFNGGNVSGVNGNTLALANIQLEDAGSYRVIVTNAFGSVTSYVAQLTVVVPSFPITLSSAAVADGVFNFSFTNTPGANFTVLSATNVSLPLSNWTALGSLVEISPGQFQFTHSKATTNQQRFYCVRAP